MRVTATFKMNNGDIFEYQILGVTASDAAFNIKHRIAAKEIIYTTKGIYINPEYISHFRVEESQ